MPKIWQPHRGKKKKKKSQTIFPLPKCLLSLLHLGCIFQVFFLYNQPQTCVKQRQHGRVTLLSPDSRPRCFPELRVWICLILVNACLPILSRYTFIYSEYRLPFSQGHVPSFRKSFLVPAVWNDHFCFKFPGLHDFLRPCVSQGKAVLCDRDSRWPRSIVLFRRESRLVGQTPVSQPRIQDSYKSLLCIHESTWFSSWLTGPLRGLGV